jgi:CRISPR-associated protein Csb2
LTFRNPRSRFGLRFSRWRDRRSNGAELGFGQTELQALDQLIQLRQLGHRPELRLVLLDLSRPADSGGAPLIGPSQRWRSATPFVPPRHQKFRGTKRENPPDQLCRELVRRGLPQPASVRSLPRCPLVGRDLSWRDFRLQRLQGQGDRGQGFAYGFELEFAEPVLGPLALGYGCHFGLGLFAVAAL